jgi:hypothetical protein
MKPEPRLKLACEAFAEKNPQSCAAHPADQAHPGDLDSRRARRPAEPKENLKLKTWNLTRRLALPEHKPGNPA